MKCISTILAVLLLPLSLWAMTPVADSDLSNVTGQAGVNINADLTMNISIGTMAWGDSDGVAPDIFMRYPPFGGVVWSVKSGGFVGIDNFNLTNLKVKARADSTDIWNGYSTFFLKPITIDVATGDKTAVGGSADQTFVRFGLGSLFISMDALSMNIGTSAGYTTGAVTISDIMGSINMGAMQMYINPTSYVDIFSHAGTGVSFQMRITIDRFSMGYMSWGDADGVASYVTDDVTWMGAPSQGYIGLDNMNFGSATAPAFTITGTAAIDVVTSRGGEYAIMPPAWAATLNNFIANRLGEDPATYVMTSANWVQYHQWLRNQGGLAIAMNYYARLTSNPDDTLDGFAPGGASPVSVVHITFPENFNFTMSEMRTAVKLANNANLNTTGGVAPKQQVLGDIYIGGLAFTVRQGSWVDIWAH